MSVEEREQFAALAGTEVSYLYQIGGCHREPKVGLAFHIEDASATMSQHNKSLPRVTARDLARMCANEETTRKLS
jgi:hypothetical protein